MELLDIMQAMRLRHSVRSYLDQPIESEKVEILQHAIDEINAKSGLRAHLILDEPQAFTGPLAHYGSFKGCKNYIVITGAKTATRTSATLARSSFCSSNSLA